MHLVEHAVYGVDVEPVGAAAEGEQIVGVVYSAAVVGDRDLGQRLRDRNGRRARPARSSLRGVKGWERGSALDDLTWPQAGGLFGSHELAA